jgi:hypothetical protein
MNSIRTDASGWQIGCWKLAKAKKRFEVHGFQPKHLWFLEEIRSAYGYRLMAYPNKIVFSPSRSI